MKKNCIAIFIAICLLSCKAKYPDPVIGEWEVKRAELLVVPEEKYEAMARGREAIFAYPYSKLRYIFHKDSTFERMMINGADTLNARGRILFDTSYHITGLVCEKKGRNNIPDTLPVFTEGKLYKVMESMEVGFADQYLQRIKK